MGNGSAFALQSLLRPAMRQRLLRNVSAGRLLVIILAVLTLALGFCLIDNQLLGMDSHHGMSPDYCASLLMLTTILLTLLGLAAVGVPLADPVRPVYAVSLVGLDHPPKLLSFS